MDSIVNVLSECCSNGCEELFLNDFLAEEGKDIWRAINILVKVNGIRIDGRRIMMRIESQIAITNKDLPEKQQLVGSTGEVRSKLNELCCLLKRTSSMVTNKGANEAISTLQ